MADVRAFRGLRYSLERVRMADVVAPPYDVISPSEKERLKARSSYNVVRLILPDGDGDKYARAARLLDEWTRQGVLRRESFPALYFCRHTFQVYGQTLVRTGLMAAVKLEPFGRGAIFPHESTLSAPKEDRMRLLRATRTNLSPVFSLFSDRTGGVRQIQAQVVKAPPTFVLQEESGLCEFWMVSDRGVIDRLSALLAPSPLFIADGHHRYETALSYLDDLRREGNCSSSAEAVMMLCVAMEDPGLAVLPTHRLLKAGVGPGWRGLLEALRADFETVPVTDGIEGALAEPETTLGRFVLYGPQHQAWSLTLKEGFDLKTVDPDQSPDWCRLDVAILQRRVFQPLLSLSLERLTGSDLVGYSHDLGETTRRVEEGSYASAFLMRPTPVGAVAAVANRLEKMPPKSTFFYPKALTGLVLRPLLGVD